jgi:hypothetical protein
VDAILLLLHCDMSMAAEDTIGAMHACVEQSTGGNLGRKPQPAGIQAVNRPGQRLALEIKFLQLQIEPGSQIVEPHVINAEPVKLMPVDRQMVEAGMFPLVFLIHLHAHQVRHHIRQSLVVISFDPHNFNISFGIGKLANVSEKLPMLFGESSEIKVSENIAQENEPPKTIFLQDTSGAASAARLRSQMYVREDQRVVWRPIRRHIHT